MSYSATCEPSEYKAWNEGFEEGKSIGRAEAIDEFINALEKHQQENWIDNLEYGITFADIEEVAEQLKEQKND